MNYTQSTQVTEYLTEFDHILKRMINGMTTAVLADSISYNFIVQMIPHHRAAIEMSQNILKYTDSSQLQEIAKSIITEQTKSIADMQAIQQTCLCAYNSPRELQTYQTRTAHIMDTMFCEMKNAPANERVNCDFMWEMIPHHLGAVRMSKNALCNRICPQLKPILTAIITSQEKGIQEMQRLLSCMGCRA